MPLNDDVRVPGGEAPGTRTLSGRRRPALIAIAVTLSGVAIVAGGWLTATAFVSPRQIEAAASPPPAPALTATVERGDLRDERTFGGTVAFAAEQDLLVSPIPGAGRSVVTEVVTAPSATVSPGAHVLSVNDRPVFLVESAFPFFRDLGPGDRGSDVEALQRTLVTAGLLDGADGAFGPRTAGAVRLLFERIGEIAPSREVATGSPPSAKPADGGEAATTPATPVPAVRETYLPLSAVLTSYLSPAVVTSAPSVGDVVESGSTVTVASSDVVVEAALFDGVTARDVIGRAVSVSVSGRQPFAGRAVAESAAEPMTDGETDTDAASSGETAEDPGGTADETATGQPEAGDVLVVRPDDPAALDRSLVGGAATLTLTVATLAEGALIVPRSAVAENAGDRGSLLVRSANGFTLVDVRIIASLGGRIAVDGSDPLLVDGAEVRIQ